MSRSALGQVGVDTESFGCVKLAVRNARRSCASERRCAGQPLDAPVCKSAGSPDRPGRRTPSCRPRRTVTAGHGKG
jgi:hypothetical protein